MSISIAFTQSEALRIFDDAARDFDFIEYFSLRDSRTFRFLIVIRCWVQAFEDRSCKVASGIWTIGRVGDATLQTFLS